MSTKVIKLRDFKPENVKFSTPRNNKHGGKAVYVNYDYEDGSGPKPLRIQMPKMKAPFGISGWDKSRADKKDTSPTETSNDTLEFSTGAHQEIIEKLQILDEMVIEQAVANSKEYFKKKYDEAYIKMQYKSAVKFNENEDGEVDDKYPPRLKTKLYKDEEFNYKLQVYDVDNKPLKVSVYNYNEVLPKGCECVALLECAGIWIINEKFGLSWRPAQMKVYKSDFKLVGCAIVEDEEDNKTEQNEDPHSGDEGTGQGSNGFEVEESENEEVEETVSEPEEDPLDQVTEAVENVSVAETKPKRKRRT